MVAEIDRLGMLQMSHSRQHRIGMFACGIQKGFDHAQYKLTNDLIVCLYIESKIECNLIVSTSGRMQFFTRISNKLR